MIHAKLKLNQRHEYEVSDILRNFYAIFPKTTAVALLNIKKCVWNIRDYYSVYHVKFDFSLFVNILILNEEKPKHR